MKEFIFIRHGATFGNLECRYVGSTDEALSPAGRAALTALTPPAADRLYCSPMRRCVETAAALYPQCDPVKVNDFRECDFGDFEYKNHRELSGDPRYQAWLDSGGASPFPGGECRAAFCTRCRAAFSDILAAPWSGRAALVLHGGTIMAILSGFALPPGGYFDYQVKNGCGFLCRAEGQRLRILNAIPHLQK